MKLAIGTRRDCDPRVKVDGRRHNEAFIIIRVLAYQVDAPRSAVYSRVAMVEVVESPLHL